MQRAGVYTVIAFAFVAVAAGFQEDIGPYCERPGRGSNLCCRGREDGCSLPRGYGPMETLCYCDDFCVRSHPRPMIPDCCPDYEYACRNGSRPSEIRRQCYYKGRYFNDNEVFKNNCEMCSCKDMGSKMFVMCTSEPCLVNERLISDVNRQRRGWLAGNVTNFWGRTLENGKSGMLGTLFSSRKVRTMNAIMSVARKSSLPRHFDWRADRRQVISPIIDQNFCNASWSFSIVSTFSDRYRKWSNGTARESLSYQQHRNCVRGQRREHPCAAGHLTKSWKYLMNTGLVETNCYPSSPSTRCEISERRLSTKTHVTCPNGRGQGRLHKASALSRIAGEAAIMKEIIDAGPVIATMRVFPEFFVYRSGVYDCPSGRAPKTGQLHSVKIVGWGEESDYYPVPYWIVANSWGTAWGEDGFFRIRRGTNACDIEEFVLSFYTNTRRWRRSPRPKNPFLEH